MGNHNVGRAMSAAAKAFWAGNGDAPVTKERALAVLDAAAEDFIGADAEFDDELWEVTPLSRLVAIAFDATPDELADLRGELDEGRIEDSGELWYDGPHSRFSKRYRFC
ncbi:MAG: hypothetical protein WBB98_04835 [Xanthobacteraceae bacterium]